MRFGAEFGQDFKTWLKPFGSKISDTPWPIGCKISSA